MKYPGRDYQIRVHDEIMQEFSKGNNPVAVMPTRSGKCTRYDQKVIMADGTIKESQYVKQGDLLLGPDGLPRQVLEVHSGLAQLYKIERKYRDPIYVTGNHILTLRMDNEIIHIPVEDYLKRNKTFKHKAKLFHSECIEFSSNKSPFKMDPYDSGVLLMESNDIDQIPIEFLTSRREYRMRLLFGILKTDKYKRKYVVNVKNKSLSDGICFLARSLGFLSYSKFEKNRYCITILTESSTNHGFKISLQNTPEKYVGFSLDRDHLYLLDDFTVFHNSWNICHIAELGYQNDRPVLICVHTDILLDQISFDLLDHGIPHGVIKSGHYESKDTIQVASRNTIAKRLSKYPRDHFKVVCVDEGHLSKGKTYMDIIQHFSSAKLVLFTATPIRLSGEGFDDICQSMVKGPTKMDLIKRGIILPTEIALPEKTLLQGMKSSGGDYNKKDQEKALTGQYIHGEYVKHYREFADGKKGLIFCPTVDFAKVVTDNFNSNGIPTVEISARDSKSVRSQKLSDYYAGKYLLMASVDLFIMGFHLREGEVVVQLRPTQSTMVYYQMLGRCTMPNPETGKEKQIVIDCVNNIWTHGHSDIEPEWSLEGETKKQRIASQAIIGARMVRCDSCKWAYDAAIASQDEKGNIICPKCGAIKERSGSQLKMIDGNLKIVTADEWYAYEMQKKYEIEQQWLEEQRVEREKAEKRLEVRNAKTKEELLEIAKKRGYNLKWVEHRLAAKKSASERHRGGLF